MRGANVNYTTKKEGKTALHYVIERGMPNELVKWLIKAGANPHIEDHEGLDSCDRAKQMNLYQNVKVLWNNDCIKKPELRKKFIPNVFNLLKLNTRKKRADLAVKLFNNKGAAASNLERKSTVEDVDIQSVKGKNLKKMLIANNSTLLKTPVRVIS